LTPDGDQLRCPRGHSFDRAREGYWNLLQPQDRRSRNAGDRDIAVAARRRWLTLGFADGLVAELRKRGQSPFSGGHSEASTGKRGLSPFSNPTAVDVGCGEGTLTARLFASRDVRGCGVDLSTAAIRLAAKLAPDLTWIVANADRGLPFADGSIDLALSIFGRRPASELRRVMAPRGKLLVVVPGEDDLIELRQAAQGEGRRQERAGDALAQLAPHFELVAGSTWRHRARHDRDALIDALAMSYRGARASERLRLSSVSSLDVTLAADILTLVPRGGLR
jgi:23S rRNA (guanine745-N1)-methyltransferase